MPSEFMEEIQMLSDEELQQQLSEYGINIGPIVETTRRVYQRKLAALRGSSVPESPYSEEVDLDESDGFVTTTQKTTYTSTKTSSPMTTRKRYTHDDSSSLSFDHDIHTPSPRPSLRTVTTSKSSQVYTSLTNQERSRLFGERTITQPSHFSSFKESTPGGNDQPFFRFVVKMIFIMIIIATAWLTYMYYYSESPYSQLENLARQALNSIEMSKSQQKAPGGGGKN